MSNTTKMIIKKFVVLSRSKYKASVAADNARRSQQLLATLIAYVLCIDKHHDDDKYVNERRRLCMPSATLHDENVPHRQ